MVDRSNSVIQRNACNERGNYLPTILKPVELKSYLNLNVPSVAVGKDLGQIIPGLIGIQTPSWRRNVWINAKVIGETKNLNADRFRISVDLSK